MRSGRVEIRRDGSVWRLWKYGRPIEPRRMGFPDKNGYLTDGVFEARTKFNIKLHRLVYIHFHGDIPDGHVINHINGIKDDNRPDNLEAVTRRENVNHMYEVLGSGLRGEASPKAKLTEEQVREVKRCYTGKRGEMKAFADKFHVCISTIDLIVRGENWKHVS